MVAMSKNALEQLLENISSELSDDPNLRRALEQAGRRFVISIGGGQTTNWQRNPEFIQNLKGQIRREMGKERIKVRQRALGVIKPKRRKRPITQESNGKVPPNSSAIKEYHAHYEGIGRAELSRDHRDLYDRLVQEGTLEEVSQKPLPETKRTVKKKMRKKKSRPRSKPSSYENPWQEYVANYKGLSRSQIARANQRLYRDMLDDGSINNIPRKKKGRKNGYERENGSLETLNKNSPAQDSEENEAEQTPWQEYIANHQGIGREELSKVNRSLYDRMRGDDSIEKIPLQKTGRKATHPTDPQEQLRIYQERYDGLCGEELKRVDYALYTAMRRSKALKNITKKKGGRRKKVIRSPEETLRKYVEKYEGKGRKWLQRNDSRLYREMEENRSLQRIAKLPTGNPPKPIKPAEETWAQYVEKYNGMGRNDLYETDRKLHREMIKNGSIERIPLKSRGTSSHSPTEVFPKAENLEVKILSAALEESQKGKRLTAHVTVNGKDYNVYVIPR